MKKQDCPKTVVLVEDDAALREAVAEALEDEGYRVLAAEHGQDALDRLSTLEETPCLILLDLMMPVMNGWAFREAQKEDPAIASVPVIVFSADASTKDTAKSLGAQGYLCKPVDLEQLLGQVEQYC